MGLYVFFMLAVMVAAFENPLMDNLKANQELFADQIEKEKSSDYSIKPDMHNIFIKDRMQAMEIEFLELKAAFQEKGKQMEKEMEKLKSVVSHQKYNLENMATVIDNLQETVISQIQTIDVLKNSIMQRDYTTMLASTTQKHTQTIKGTTYRMENLENIEENPDRKNKTLINNVTIKKTDDSKRYTNVSKRRNENALPQKFVKLQKQYVEYPNGDENQLKNTSRIFIPTHIVKNKQGEKEMGTEITKIKRQTVTEGNTAFSAYLSHSIPHLAVGHTIKCDQVILNDGLAYSQFTGVFTVPETGVYLLTFTFDVFYNNHYEGVRLVVNNRHIVDAIAEGNDNKHAMGGNTAIVRLTKDEKVWLESYYSSDGEIQSTTNSRLTTFSGVLLYY